MCSIISSVLGRRIHLYWTIPEKKKKQGTPEYGVEDMERYSKWIFWGLIKRNMEFPGVIKKKP